MIIIETRQGIHFLWVLMINLLKIYFQSKVIGNVLSSCPNHFSENFISFKLSRFCNLIRDFSSNFFYTLEFFIFCLGFVQAAWKKSFVIILWSKWKYRARKWKVWVISSESIAQIRNETEKYFNHRKWKGLVAANWTSQRAMCFWVLIWMVKKYTRAPTRAKWNTRPAVMCNLWSSKLGQHTKRAFSTNTITICRARTLILACRPAPGDDLKTQLPLSHFNSPILNNTRTRNAEGSAGSKINAGVQSNQANSSKCAQ
jgi:hypothetical protein